MTSKRRFFLVFLYQKWNVCVCVCVCVCVRRLAEWKERLCVDVISDCRQRCRLQAVWTRRVAAVSRWPSPRPLVHRHSHPASLQSASSRSRRFTQHPTNHRIVHTTPTPPPPHFLPLFTVSGRWIQRVLFERSRFEPNFQ